MFCKMVVFKNSSKNACAIGASFLKKLQVDSSNFIKNVILAQEFSCDFWEIFKNTFFYRSRLVAACALSFTERGNV